MSFFTNSKAINHISISDRLEKKSNIEDNFYDNIDELVVECIPENFQRLELPFFI